MGFSSYYSVVKHLERSWSQNGSLSSFYVQGHGQALGSCFSARKPIKKGREGRHTKAMGRSDLAMRPGLQLEPQRYSQPQSQSIGHWSPSSGSALFCVCCFAQAIPRKQRERGRGMLMRLAEGVQCQPSLVCRESRAGGEEGGQGRCVPVTHGSPPILPMSGVHCHLRGSEKEESIPWPGKPMKLHLLCLPRLFTSLIAAAGIGESHTVFLTVQPLCSSP